MKNINSNKKIFIRDSRNYCETYIYELNSNEKLVRNLRSLLRGELLLKLII